MASGKKNKIEYKIYVYNDHIEYIRSDDYEVKKIEIKKNIEEHYIVTVYVDGRIELSIDMKYLPIELNWIANKEKLYEYSRTFGEATIVQKVAKELTKYISEYFKL